jgi:hypothetical protein
VFNLFGQVVITNSTLSGNTALGGSTTGLNNTASAGSGLGGAIFNLNGSLTLTYATLANNTGQGGSSSQGTGSADGGGVYNLAFGLTTAGNTPTASVSLFNSILGTNTVHDLFNQDNTDAGNATVVGGSTNLIVSTNVTATGLIVSSANPLLGPLQSNGGFFPQVQTQALQAGSPALGVANTTLPGLPTIDQRGLPRPASGADLAAAQSQTTATSVSPVSATFNSGTQTITLTATVTTNGQPLPLAAGSVTFTVDGLPSVTVTPVPAGGVATTTLTLPAGFAAGTYGITAAFSDSSGVFSPSSNITRLTVASAPTSVSVSPAFATFNSATQKVTLTANLTSSNGGTVNEGIVTFTVNGLSPVQGTVNRVGIATATLNLPADFNAGTYTLNASYTDTPNANETVNFLASATVGTLTVSPAATAIGIGDVSAVFNTATQTVTFSATVTSPTVRVVDEGNVTFTVASVSATAAVANGVATITVQLPPGFSATPRPVTASYADNILNPNGVVNFAASTGTGTLFINPAATQVALTTITLVPDPGKMRETATAQVISPAGLVTEGFVTFTIAGLTVIAPVVNGIATGAVIVGPFAAGNPQKAQAVYSDSVGNFTTSNTGGKLVCLTGFDGVFPTTVMYTADGGQVVTTDIFGIPLVFTYSNTGRITSVFFGFLPLWLAL